MVVWLRFGELEKSLAGISPRTLSQRLDDLENCGIITKKAYAEVPPKVEYTITQKGLDIVPALQQLANWGAKYYEKPANQGTSLSLDLSLAKH